MYAQRFCRTVATALLLSATACASGGSAGEPAAAPNEAPAQVRVENNNWSDMTVYLLRSGAKLRLGTVTSMESRVFDIPERYHVSTRGIQLIADPVGSSRTWVSPTVQVTSGAEVDLTIENSLPLSSVAVWGR